MLNTLASIYQGGASGASPSFESIQTVTVGSGGASSISFTSIPATYASLQIRYLAQVTNSGYVDYYNILFSVNTSTSYTQHYLLGSGATASASGSASGTTTYLNTYVQSGTANLFSVGIVDIHNYASTTQNKTVRTIGGYDANGTGFLTLSSNLSINTAAINSITLAPDHDKFSQYSTFFLYGIKGA